MPGFLWEEKGHYALDCRKAVWASGEMHQAYHDCGLSDYLSDADFVLQTDGNGILVVEYKNAKVPEAVAHAPQTKPYNPHERKSYERIVRKFYGTLPFLMLEKKTRLVRFVFVAEYPNDNSVSRNLLRQKLKKLLPFELQERFHRGVKLIDEVDVVSIKEWNAHSIYGQFPLIQSQGLPGA